MFARNRSNSIMFALLYIGCAFLVAGCGGASVEGEVTLDGKPVENGAITFTSADLRGPSAGAQITAGRYRVEDITPGEKVVQIVSVGSVPIARTTEELAQQAEATAGKPSPTPPANNVRDAAGNNARVVVESTAQTLDFHLTSAAPKGN